VRRPSNHYLGRTNNEEKHNSGGESTERGETGVRPRKSTRTRTRQNAQIDLKRTDKWSFSRWCRGKEFTVGGKS